MSRLKLFTTLVVTLGLMVGLGAVAYGQLEWARDEGFYLRVPPSGSPTMIPSQYSASYDTIDGWTQARPDSIIYNNELNEDAAFLRFDIDVKGADVVLDSMLLTLRGNPTFDPNTDLKPIHPDSVVGATAQIRSKRTGIQFYVEAEPPTDRNPDEFDNNNIAVGPSMLSTATAPLWSGPVAVDGGPDQLWTAMFTFEVPIAIDHDDRHEILEFTRIWVVVQTQGCHLEGDVKVGGLAPEDTFAVMLDSTGHFFARITQTSTVIHPGTDIIVNDRIRPDWCDGNAWEHPSANPPWEAGNRWSCATPVHGWDLEEGPEVAFIVPEVEGLFTSDTLQVIKATATDPGQCVDWCRSYVLLDTCTQEYGTGNGHWYNWHNYEENKPDTLWMAQVVVFDTTLDQYVIVSDLLCTDGVSAEKYEFGYGFTVILGVDCVDTIKIAPGHWGDFKMPGGYGAQNIEWRDGWIVSVHIHTVDQGGNWTSPDVHTYFTVDHTPPTVSQTECGPEGGGWGHNIGSVCHTSDTGQKVRWKVEDKVGPACLCAVPAAGVDPDSLFIYVRVDGCDGGDWWKRYNTLGEIDTVTGEVDLTKNYLTWNPPYLTFDPPDCYYKSGEKVCIDVRACDAVNLEWDENTYNYSGTIGEFNKNCRVLTAPSDIPCFCVDTEPPTVTSHYPPDNSWTNDSCTPIVFWVNDFICPPGDGTSPCAPAGVGGGWMKIKITDREGNKYHLDEDGEERIPGHGTPFNPLDPEADGWMNTASMTTGDSVVYNPLAWIDWYDPVADTGFIFKDGDHVCVRVVPFDDIDCCGSEPNFPHTPFTWEFNVDEYTPHLLEYDTTWYEHCCQLDSSWLYFALSDIPEDTLYDGERPEWYNDKFNCLQAGINGDSVWFYVVVNNDTLPFGPGSDRIYIKDGCCSYFSNMYVETSHRLVDRCGKNNLRYRFYAHLDSTFSQELYDSLAAHGSSSIGFWAHYCDSTTVPWKSYNCQLCDPCPVPTGRIANCGSTYFEINIVPDEEFERDLWSDDYYPEPGYHRLDDLFIREFPDGTPIRGPVIGASIFANIDHFLYETARMTVWVKRGGEDYLAYDGFYQHGCDECDLWGWYREFCVNDYYFYSFDANAWFNQNGSSIPSPPGGPCKCGPFQVCCGGGLTVEEINLKLVTGTMIHLGPQPVPLKDDLNAPESYYLPEYLDFMHCDEITVTVSAWADTAIWGTDPYLDEVCEECPSVGGHHCACYTGDPVNRVRYEDTWTFIIDEVGPVVDGLNLHTYKGYEDISSCNLNHQQESMEHWSNFALWIEGISDDFGECEGVGFSCPYDFYTCGDLISANSDKEATGDQITAGPTAGPSRDELLIKNHVCGPYLEAYLLAANSDYEDYLCLEDWEGVSCYYKAAWDCVWLDVPEDTLYAEIWLWDDLGNLNVVDSRDFGEYLILDNVKPEPVSVTFAYDIFGEDLVNGECDPDLAAENVATLNMPGTYYAFIEWNDNMDVTREEFSVKFEDQDGTVWTVRGATRDDYPETWPKDRGEEIEVTRPGWIGSDDMTWVGVMEVDDQRMEQGDAIMMVYRFSDTACNQMKPWYCKFRLFRGCDPAIICEPNSGDYISGFAHDDSCDNIDSNALLCAFFSHPELLTGVTWQFREDTSWVDIDASENGMLGDCVCYYWNTLAAAAEGEMATIDLRIITECGPQDYDTSDVEIGVIVDNVPPVPTITNPVEGQVVTADYLVLAATIVEECIETEEWHYSLDEGENWEPIADPDYWAPENTLAEYLLRLRVYDCAGLVGCDDVHFFWRAITVGFERGGRENPTLVGAFEDAVLNEPDGLDWPGDWRLTEGAVDDLDLVPITTYVYDPGCDLWWQPCDLRGELYPGDRLFVTYRVGAGTPIDSIKTHIPGKGTSNYDKNRVYRDDGGDVGEWALLTDLNGFDYYGLRWTIFDESRFDDGLWMIDSKIYVEGTEFPDTAFIILDSEDPQYTISYFEDDGMGTLLPTITHPTFGEIPVTNKQIVDILIEVDQTVVDDLPGTGRLWSWMNIFIFAPGELVDIDGVPACGDALFPCGPGEEYDRWMNEPPTMNDTTDYHYRWNVLNANATSEGLATVFIKGRDTAGNIVDIEEAQEAGNVGLEIYIDITAPSIPTDVLITICDDGTVTGVAGAVGQDHWAQPLLVTLYDNDLLTSVVAEFWANSDGSFSTTLDPAPAVGTEIYVTATDHATNESAATSVIVALCKVPFSYDMDTGWNMASVPVEPDDATLSLLFPDAQAMWKYGGTYLPATEAVTGEGIWLLYAADDTEDISGLPVRSFQKDLDAGWNLVGSCIEDVAISTIVDVSTDEFPTWISPLDVWMWSGSYLPTGTIVAGGAVWMLAQQAGTIEVTIGDGLAKAPLSVEMIEPAWMAELIVQSATQVNSVEFGADAKASTGYDHAIDRAAPPVPPASDLNVHFADDFGYTNFYRDIRALQDNLWKLHVDAQDAMTLTWDVTAIPQEMTARIRIDGTEVDMRAQSSISLTKGSHDLDVVVRIIPKAFDLAQNYPNPFNPETNISYGLPEDANVVLKVYNVLGQEIRTLVNSQQAAGFFTVTWNGTNDYGEMVSTGVYIYRITAGQYTASKRMILVK